MNLAVLVLGAPSAAMLRAVPDGFPLQVSTARDALAAASRLDAGRLLFVEPEAVVRLAAFLASATLDPEGGILGGCATEPAGWLRFGTVFIGVPYGPYEAEPQVLVDATRGKGSVPPADAIDAVAPGMYIVDKEAFIAVGGFDPVLGSPWRVYDLCARLRAHGAPVRWDSRLAFSLDLGIPGPADAADKRAFLGSRVQLSAHRRSEGPALGTVRRTVRLPLGQRETVLMPLPPTEVVLFGDGSIGPAQIRASTKVPIARLIDARGPGAQGLAAFETAFRGRSDRYVAFVDASSELEQGWLEEMLLDLDWAPNVGAVRANGRAVFAVGRVPLDVQPVIDGTTFDAIDALVGELRARGRSIRFPADVEVVAPSPRRRAEDLAVSVVVAAHSVAKFHRTSFESLYAADLGVDYHVVGSPLRSDALANVRTHSTLDLIVDDSRGLATGMNAAMYRAKGDLIVVIGDDFYAPTDWLLMVREAFALRPDAGIIGFSSINVDGPQQVADIGYPDILAFRAYVARRREMHRREAALADRLSALAFAIDARALGAVGGFDERLGIGRWGLEDLVLRVRAAGYSVYVTQDLFVHRYLPSESEPLASDAGDEARRATLFARKWGIREADVGTFNPMPLIARGFDPALHYVPLRDIVEHDRPLLDEYRMVFAATCENAEDVDLTVAAVGRYLSGLRAGDGALFAIGLSRDLDAELVSSRVRAAVRKAQAEPSELADILIASTVLSEDWLGSLPRGPRLRVHDGANALSSIEALGDPSPSGYRRAVRENVRGGAN